MGLLDRLMGRPRQETPPQSGAVRFTLLAGDDDLEVVGESNYQEALWGICGARKGNRIRHSINAMLVPEPLNPHDANAVAVYIDGHLIGYLDRSTAAQYVASVHSLMARHGSHVGLRGHVVGGGHRDHGLGFLGVWLEHDPADFGMARAARSGGRPVAEGAAMRTGFSEAWLTDAEDDSYDLSWYNELPDGDRAAIAMLRDLLATDPDPIDRHFQFAELESRLYRCRDLYASALDEFDEACRLHDAEMESICGAFRTKWHKIPLLETYRQMAIRQQKKKDWDACLWWAERGLELYGESAARQDAVEDLEKRRNRAAAKLEATARPAASATQVVEVTLQPPSPSIAELSPVALAELEILICSRCASTFERLRVRGRKPQLCPICRAH
ncbi:HIRAN domain-containing protein [Kribbella qitaiheensis]|uniref:HIRAN domain-containing protein n=1 Tax=Kribbella qitaiheensis TaxID=1544730 RepID=UPI00360D9C3A